MSQQDLNPAIFSFTTGSVRVIVRDDEPWFVAADVCAALGISRTDDGMTRLDEDEKGTALVRTPGGAQSMSIINESGLYSLVLGSRKPEAKPFKKWVTREVLPAIRKSGRYEVGEPPPAVVRSPRLDAQIGRMAGSVDTMAGSVERVAGHMATLAAGMTTMQMQIDVTAKYIGLLETNQRGVRRVTAAVVREAKAMHAEGISQADIARLLRVSRTTASLVIRDKYPIAIPEDGAPGTRPSASEALERWIAREQETLAATLSGEVAR